MIITVIYTSNVIVITYGVLFFFKEIHVPLSRPLNGLTNLSAIEYSKKKLYSTELLLIKIYIYAFNLFNIYLNCFTTRFIIYKKFEITF